MAISPPHGLDVFPEVPLVTMFPPVIPNVLEETANRLIAESDCIVATGDRIFLRSQILALLSSEPEMIFSSCDVKIADVTVS